MEFNSKTSVTNQLIAMNSDLFFICIYNRTKDKMYIHNKLNIDHIIKNIPIYKSYNLYNHDIYIAPDKTIDRALILVDDINTITIEQMKNRGINPACIIETSPQNHQAWVSLGEDPMPSTQRIIVSRIFVAEFGADKGSIGASHLGRLAGFTNRKPEYLINNVGPNVECVEFTGQHAKKSFELREWAKSQEEKELIGKRKISISELNKLLENNNLECPEETFINHYKEWYEYNIKNGRAIDYSCGDFAVACVMLKEGYNYNIIIELIKKYSPDIENRKKNHIDDYANRTVHKALSKI